MKKNIFAACMVASFLLIFTRCSEDEIVADNEMRQTAVEQQRDNESARKKQSKYIATPITGTINGIAFSAEYRITKFVAENNILYAVGSLSNITGTGLPGTVTNLAGQQIRMPVQRTTDPNAAADASIAQVGSCDILFLQLGPLDLDLLGLQIHLDQVTLEIDAATGPGNLLGNLLCAITGLFDSGGPLAAIAELLNQIIDLIGTLG